MNILEKIVEQKKKEIAERKGLYPVKIVGAKYFFCVAYRFIKKVCATKGFVRHNCRDKKKVAVERGD